MNDSVYRNSHRAMMVKGATKNNANGTFSSEERNNTDDLDELPSDAASEGNDDTYDKYDKKAAGTSHNFYQSKEQGQQYDKIVEQSREHYDDSDSSGMDDDQIDMSVGDELEICDEGRKEKKKGGVISYIKKKMTGNSVNVNVYDHHHDHQHKTTTEPDGRFTHLNSGV